MEESVMEQEQKQSFPFIGLLVSFVVLFVTIPIAEYLDARGVFIDVSFTLIIVFSVYVVAERPITFALAAILALPGIFIGWTGWFDEVALAQNLRMIFSITLSSYVGVILLSHILQTKKVDVNIIYGAVCVYLLLGLIWNSAYALAEFNIPGSLSGIEPLPQGLTAYEIMRSHAQSFFYYSYITLTTLGYGNIAPVNAAAGALAASEAVIGQLYIAILIARLVGLYIAQRS